MRSISRARCASALRIEADELVAYDRRLLTAGADHGLATATPGASFPGGQGEL